MCNPAGLASFLNTAHLHGIPAILQAHDLPPGVWNLSLSPTLTCNPESIHPSYSRTKAFNGAAAPVLSGDIMSPAALSATPAAQRHLLSQYDTHPIKRFPFPRTLIYTDASKKGDSITGAVLRPELPSSPTHIAHTFHLPTHPQPQHTVLYGELAAIREALTLLNTPAFAGPQIIMTDSLNAIYLLKQALSTPEKLRHHAHRVVLQEMAHMLLTRTDALSLYKVRAHSGIAGNDAVDRLAKEAHNDPPEATRIFTPAGSPVLPATWITYASTNTGHPAVALPPDDTRPVSSLTGHLRSIAQCHHVSHMLARARPTTSVMQKITALLDAGIDTKATCSIWNSSLVTARVLRTALRIRFNRMWTTARAQLIHGTTAVPSTHCPWCSEGIDDADHALNHCKMTQAIHKIKLRHDSAVHRFRTAIQAHARGNHYLHSDARNTVDPSSAAAPPPADPDAGTSRKLPAAFLTLDQQHSFPDITLIDIPHSVVQRFVRCGRRVPPRTRAQSTIDILEIKYAFDLLLPHRVQPAIDQHALLRDALLRDGWGTVNIHPLILGSGGTIPAACHTVLSLCGVTDSSTRDLLLRRISIDGAIRSAAIVAARPWDAPTPPPTPPAGGPAASPTPPPTGSPRLPTFPTVPLDPSPPPAVPSRPTRLPSMLPAPASPAAAPRTSGRTRTPSQRLQEARPAVQRPPPSSPPSFGPLPLFSTFPACSPLLSPAEPDASAPATAPPRSSGRKRHPSQRLLEASPATRRRLFPDPPTLGAVQTPVDPALPPPLPGTFLPAPTQPPFRQHPLCVPLDLPLGHSPAPPVPSAPSPPPQAPPPPAPTLHQALPAAAPGSQPPPSLLVSDPRPAAPDGSLLTAAASYDAPRRELRKRQAPLPLLEAYPVLRRRLLPGTPPSACSTPPLSCIPPDLPPGVPARPRPVAGIGAALPPPQPLRSSPPPPAPRRSPRCHRGSSTPRPSSPGPRRPRAASPPPPGLPLGDPAVLRPGPEHHAGLPFDRG